MMLMMMMALRRDVVDVENVIVMMCMYMGDAVTMIDIPGGGNRVVKGF